jgi:Rod binding domain-containing protein
MQVQYASPLTTSVAAPAVNTGGDAASLRRHAIEFEAMLLTQVLEKMEHTYSCVPGEQPADAAHDTEGSLATQALATGIAKAGGFGFAKMILKYLPQPDAANNQSGSANSISGAQGCCRPQPDAANSQSGSATAK